MPIAFCLLSRSFCSKTKNEVPGSLCCDILENEEEEEQRLKVSNETTSVSQSVITSVQTNLLSVPS